VSGGLWVFFFFFVLAGQGGGMLGGQEWFNELSYFLIIELIE
jgi:hypothetical protein